MGTTLPRIVLVEDDPAMQLYVDTALRGLDIELVFCSSVAQATAAFEEGAVRLLITDLMLPGESGVDLIERVRADPARYGAPRVVVASAAVDAHGIVARLRELGVWRMLAKPVPLDALESCVIDALRMAPDPAVGEITPATSTSVSAAESPGGAVDTFFGGDRALHAAYRTACEDQFEADVAEGDRCVTIADVLSLRRLAHSLKSVLETLGENGAAQAAMALEASALQDDMPRVRARWSDLRTALRALRPAG